MLIADINMTKTDTANTTSTTITAVIENLRISTTT